MTAQTVKGWAVVVALGLAAVPLCALAMFAAWLCEERTPPLDRRPWPPRRGP